MNNLFAIIGAAIAGICVALEPNVNSGLGKVIPLRLVVFHSLLVGMVIMVTINLFSGGFREYKEIVKAPPYFWIGGILGVIIVYFGAKVTPVIGLASTVTVMVAAQLVTGVLMDHFGFMGASKVPIDYMRVIGIILMIFAVKLIVR